MISIGVILGSTREGRNGEKVATWFMDQANAFAKGKDIEFELLDLRDYPMPFYQELKHPSMLHGHCSSHIAEKWMQKIAEKDGFIMITAEYNHAPPAVLKNAIDYPYEQWNDKPVGFVSYGGIAGGARAVEMLTMIVRELALVALQPAIHLPSIKTAFDENGKFTSEYHIPDVTPILTQLQWYAELLKPAREKRKS